MPGFANPQRGNAIIASNQAAFTPDDVSYKVFYGFKYDVLTGRLVIDKIDGDETIYIPDGYVSGPEDYIQWVLTQNRMVFSWNSEKSSHLLVEVN